MKRIIRLTENDLARIVRRVINENDQPPYKEGEYAQVDLEKYAKDNSSEYKKGKNGGYTTYTYTGNEYKITLSLSESREYETGFVNICVTRIGSTKMCDVTNYPEYNRNWDTKQLNYTIRLLQSYTK
jgi:hypothetical protein